MALLRDAIKSTEISSSKLQREHIDIQSVQYAENMVNWENDIDIGDGHATLQPVNMAIVRNLKPG